jgi:hypothetical protein
MAAMKYLRGLKRLENEADHSSPATAMVKIAWSYTSTHPYGFTSCCQITENFTFLRIIQEWDFVNAVVKFRIPGNWEVFII